MALEKVTCARFVVKSATSVTVAFTCTVPVVDGMGVSICNGNATVARSVAQRACGSAFSGSATFAELNADNFDFSAQYVLRADGVPAGARISKLGLVDDKQFTDIFETEDVTKLEYGALYTDSGTLFRVWAPLAKAVKLKLYADGFGPSAAVRVMVKRLDRYGVWHGVWELYVNGDLDGRFYNYVVDNGVPQETVDPYAKACNINGIRGAVVSRASVDPVGWADDRHLYAIDPDAADTPVVWEVHVNDFSSSADSGMKYKGKYLAFTEENTTVPGDCSLKTGVNYLKDLGVTYVHLNPVYDFATVDEGDMTEADDTKDSFNWGYDPQNYNIPEGSYSTDPASAHARINEFKQMVMALHKAGIGVIMDVVYNHTFTVNGQALNDTVPFYYHRTDENGSFTNLSGCGNDIASERTMARKYIVDSVLYWANEYHIDGFRFDLMGIHDRKTIEAVRAALDRTDNGNGVKLLMYGEPWTGEFGSDVTPASYTARISASGEVSPLIKHADLSSLPERVAVFNDDGRSALRGSNEPGMGWVQGMSDSAHGVAALLNGTAKGLQKASRSVAYAVAHDNFTLWDQIMGKKPGRETPLCYENALDANIARNKLVAAAYMMSPGIAFMLAGEEMGRTKYGNDNSYNSPSKLNRIVWTRQAEFASLRDTYKKLIALRRKYGKSLFSYSRSVDTDYTKGNFGASGLVVSGSRGALVLSLDANTLKGKIVIGVDTVEF